MSRLSVLIQSLALLGASPALAACPIELAVYGEREQAAEIDFRPTMGSATTTNTFKMVVGKDVMLDGVVLWSGDAARPHGSLMHQCPEGDVTGGELAACTVWEGVIYALDGGDAALLPEEGRPAAETLLLSGFGASLRYSKFWDEGKASAVPWDVFKRKGCKA